MAWVIPVIIGAAVGAGATSFLSTTGRDSSGQKVSTTDVGNVTADSVESQAAQRRLARLSKYFTTPTGVVNAPTTGTTGVMG
jgi:hypothetical protein